MKVYEKGAVKLCLAVIFCQRTLHGEAQTVSLWWRCKVVHTDWVQGCCERLAHRLTQNPSPALEEERKGKNRTNKEDVLWVCSRIWIFSTLFMKVCIFLRDVIISPLISFFAISQHRFSFQNVNARRVKFVTIRRSTNTANSILTWFKCLLNDRFDPFLIVCLWQHTDT